MKLEKLRKTSGFTLFETLVMLLCLFLFVWLCISVVKKRNQPTYEQQQKEERVQLQSPAQE